MFFRRFFYGKTLLSCWRMDMNALCNEKLKFSEDIKCFFYIYVFKEAEL